MDIKFLKWFAVIVVFVLALTVAFTNLSVLGQGVPRQNKCVLTILEAVSVPPDLQKSEAKFHIKYEIKNHKDEGLWSMPATEIKWPNIISHFKNKYPDCVIDNQAATVTYIKPRTGQDPPDPRHRGNVIMNFDIKDHRPGKRTRRISTPGGRSLIDFLNKEYPGYTIKLTTPGFRGPALAPPEDQAPVCRSIGTLYTSPNWENDPDVFTCPPCRQLENDLNSFTKKLIGDNADLRDLLVKTGFDWKKFVNIKIGFPPDEQGIPHLNGVSDSGVIASQIKKAMQDYIAELRRWNTNR